MIDTSLIVAILAFVATALGFYVNRRAVKSKSTMDSSSAAEIISKASIELLEPYRRDIHGLRIEIESLKSEANVRATNRVKELGELYAHVGSLKTEIAYLKEGSVALQTKIDLLEKENMKLRGAIDVLEKENAKLRDQLMELITTNDKPKE